MGAVALLHAPDVEHWPLLRQTLAEFDPRLHLEVFDPRRDDWRFLLPLPASARALVLGCGWGRLAASLAPLCERVYAVDADPACARFTNARGFAEGHANLLGIAAQPGTLPFAPASLHLIVLQGTSAPEASEPWRNQVADAVRLRSLLAPGGMLLLGPGIVNPCSRRRWRNILTQAGFGRVDALVTGADRLAGSWALRTAAGVPRRAALATAGRGVWGAAAVAGRFLSAWPQWLRQAGSARRRAPRVWLLATIAGSPSPSICGSPGLPKGDWAWVVRGRGLCESGCATLLAVDRDTGCASLAVKVARDRHTEAEVGGEHDVLERLQSVLPATLQETVPRPVARLVVHGLAASAQTWVEAPSLAERVQKAASWRRAQVAAQMLRVGVQWLVSLHRETAREGVVAEAMLEALIFAGLERDLERCGAAPRRRERFLALRQRARRLLGERVPLVCEHGSFTADRILYDGRAVRVTDWGLARFDGLPLADLYDLIHSLALLLADRSEPLPSDAILRAAYGDGVFGRAAGEAVRFYCTALRVQPEWGRVLVPVRLARMAGQHAERCARAEANRWLAVGVRHLEAAESFPHALVHL